MKTWQRSMIVWMTALLAGCATGGADSDSSQQAEAASGRSGCFYSGQVSNWTVLDRSNLIVYAPRESNAFQVMISPPSMELRSASELAFDSRSSRICGRAGERLIVGRSRNPRRHSIMNVKYLDERDLQRVLENYGKLPTGEVAESGESPAAEIERDLGEADEAPKQEP